MDTGNSTLFFLGHPWKLHFVFNQPLETPYAIFLIPLEISYRQPPLFGFFWNSPITLFQEISFKILLILLEIIINSSQTNCKN